MRGAGRWQSRTEVGKSEEVSLTSKPRKPSMTSCWSGALKRMLLGLQKGMLFSRSVMSNSASPWTIACQAPLSSTISWSLLKLMFTESVMLSNHLILWHSFLLLLSIFPSTSVYFRVGSLPQVAKGLKLQLQQQSFHWRISYTPI